MAIVSIGTGQDYSTIAAWEAVLDNAPLTEDEIGQLTGLSEDNAQIWWNGVNTTSNYKIRLEAANGQEADGTDNAGARVDVTSFFAEASNECHIEINGIEFFQNDTQISISLGNAASSIVITKCVFRDITSGADYGILVANCADISVDIGVCLFRNMTSSWASGVKISDANLTDVKVVNCTFYDCFYGVNEANGSFDKVQNVASCCEDVNSSYTDFANSPSNMSYCASSGDGTATGTGSIDSLRDDGTDFTGTSNDDFTLVSTGVLTGAGLAVSGESWFPSTDLAGNPWANPPSIGCFEYVTGGNQVQISDIGMGADSISGVGVSLSLGDSGQGLDLTEGLQASLNTLDMAMGTDNIAEMLAALNVNDLGAGSDYIPSVNVILTLDESASGLDVVAIGELLKQVFDSGQGSDQIGSVDVAMIINDSCVGSEGMTAAIVLSIFDVSTASDLISVIGTAFKSLNDSGVGVDSIASVTVNVPVVDSIKGVDFLPAINVALSIADGFGAVDAVIKYDVEKKIISITFSMNKRSVSCELQKRSATFELQKRSMEFSLN